MTKIRLDVTELHVESFAPAAQPAVEGTVLGAEASFPATGCIRCMGTQARMTCYDGCPTGAEAG